MSKDCKHLYSPTTIPKWAKCILCGDISPEKEIKYEKQQTLFG